MSALTATQRGRVAAERLMVDTAIITRPGNTSTFDPMTGLLTEPAGTIVFTGPCRLRQPNTQEHDTLFGERQVTTSRFIVCIPHDAATLNIGDIVTITASDDPATLAREFRIVSTPLATFTIYKGYPVETVENS